MRREMSRAAVPATAQCFEHFTECAANSKQEKHAHTRTHTHTTVRQLLISLRTGHLGVCSLFTGAMRSPFAVFIDVDCGVVDACSTTITYGYVRHDDAVVVVTRIEHGCGETCVCKHKYIIHQIIRMLRVFVRFATECDALRRKLS